MCSASMKAAATSPMHSAKYEAPMAAARMADSPGATVVTTSSATPKPRRPPSASTSG